MPRCINRLTLIPIYIMVMTLVIKFVVLKNYNIGLDEKSVISILLAEVSVILFWRPKEYVVESKVGITKDVTKAIIVFIGLNYLLSMNSLNPETPSKIKVIYIMILAPIAEELIFRGTLLKKLRVFGDKTAIIYTAIAFGLFHCNIAQIPFAITAGLILAYTVVKTNNIVYSIILHMILNGLSVALTILLKGNQYIIIMLIMLLIFACIILTLIFVSIKLSNKEVKIENESKYEKKNLYKNIGYIFSVISIVILTIVSAIDI